MFNFILVWIIQGLIETVNVKSWYVLLFVQAEVDPAVKLEFDEDSALGSNGGTTENSLISPSGLPNPGAKPKAPRVKRENKEPGKNSRSKNISLL